MGDTKTVAILCPGPSLLKTFNDAMAYDIRIGVNRAAEAFRCDYWAALDVFSPTISSPLGSPFWFCCPENYRTCTEADPSLLRMPHYSDERITLPKSLNWNWYTYPAALALAYDLGATIIDVYGNDASGVVCFDGKAFPSQHRTDARWKREASAVELVVSYIQSKGIEFKRVLP